jgi:UV DNA damage endonuclease
MFPFASHGEYGYTLEYAQEELKIAGDLANKYGHRVTTHPGQVSFASICSTAIRS